MKVSKETIHRVCTSVHRLTWLTFSISQHAATFGESKTKPVLDSVRAAVGATVDEILEMMEDFSVAAEKDVLKKQQKPVAVKR